MEIDSNLRKLVELIFIKSETALQDSSIPPCLKENDFYPKIRYVLFVRRQIMDQRWKILDDNCYNILSSHHNYLMHVMLKCLAELAFNFNVFDSFISVCSLVEYFNTEIFQAFGANFCDLNSDIVMVFYDNVLKRNFSKRGGLKRFVSHICQHKYLEWKWDRNDLDSPNGPTSPVNSDMLMKLYDEIIKEIDYQSKVQPSLAIGATWKQKTVILAGKVLSTTKVQLPVLPQKHDLFQRVTELIQNKTKANEEKRKCKKMASELKKLEKLWPGCCVSNYDSTKTDSSNLKSTASKELEDFEKHEKVIQAVIRYNRSRRSSFVNLDSHIQRADEILKRLKIKVESLIDLLNECDKE